jgi:tetratricopeptide (TPR) repeat protein
LAAWLAPVVLLWALASLPRPGAVALAQPSAYEADRARLDELIAALPLAGGAGGLGPEASARRAHLLVERAALTGQPVHSRAAAAALDDALARGRPSPALLLAKADLDLRHHRLPEARRALGRLSSLAEGPAVELLRADIALQEGRYQDARRACQAMVDRAPSWEAMARLAHLEGLRGDDASADRLYAEAQDELSAKQMRAFAWLELQRGRLHLDRGRFTQADVHYERARRAYPGYWLVEEHRAELRGAQQRFAEAAALYEGLVARTPKPELEQALGDLYAFMGRPEQARPWHEKALAAYLDSAGRGEVHYFHHLAAFYADVRGDGAEALKWARKDLQLRQSVPALDGVAWALFRAGRWPEARETMERALATGAADAHLLSRAALIFGADGHDEESGRLQARAAALNPSHTSFHAH